MPDRNPQDIIADLHEALRKNRVRWPSGAHDIDTRNIDLGRPIYDFWNTLSAIPRPAYKAAGERGAAQGMASRLMIDDNAAFMIGGEKSDGSFLEHVYIFDYAYLSSQQATFEGWIVRPFQRLRSADGRNFSVGKNHDWECGDTILFSLQGTYSVEVEPNIFTGRPDRWRHGEAYTHIINDILVMCGVLARKPDFDDTPRQSRNWDAVQDGRIRGGLKPLSPIRRLDMDRILRPSNPVLEPTGREMPFGWRRAHTKTLRHPRFTHKAGQSIPVRATQVRKDKGTAPPPIYVVD